MGLINWGTVRIPGVEKITSQPKPQNAIQTSLGREGSRVDRLGTRQAEFFDMSGGLGLHHAAETDANLTRLYYSDGLWSHIEKGLYLPPLLTTNTAVQAQDISGFRAANKSVLPVVSTLGQSNPRFYAVVGNRLYRSTSDSNPALASAHSWTDAAYFAYEGVFNDTRYLVTGGGGATDDIFGIADPSTDPTTTAAILALSSGDWVGGGAYMNVSGTQFNVFYGKIGGTSGLWFIFPNQSLLTSFRPLVLDATKSDLGNISTVTLTNIFPSFGTNLGTGTQGPSDRMTGSGVWSNASNVTADDGSYSTYTIPREGSSGNAYGFQTSYIVAEFGISSKPKAGAFSAAQIRVQAKLSDITAALGDVTVHVQLIIDGEAVGDPRTQSLSSTSDTNLDFGSTSDDWGTANINNFTKFGCRVWVTGTQSQIAAGSDDTISVDFVEVLNLVYQETGDQATVPLGGRLVGVDAFNPTDLYFIAPEIQDDATGYTVPRVLWKVAVDWNSSQQRPVCTPEMTATGLINVEAAAFDDAGYLWVAGDNSSGIGKAVKRLDKQGGITDMELFPDEGLTESWGVVNLVGSGSNCIAELALEDASVLQSWICVGVGKWSPISARLSISSLPLRVAGTAVDVHQHYRHRIYPASTNLANSRQYHPNNFLLNPLVNLTSIDKEDGVLVAQTALIDLLGPPEALKTLLIAQCNSSNVSASNTIRLRYRSSLTGSWTTWATFTATGSRSVLSTPVKFSQVQFEVGLDRGSTTTDTPNGLAFLIEGTSKWPNLRRLTVTINPEDRAFQNVYGAGGFEELVTALQTLQASNPNQTLKTADSLSYYADWIDYSTGYQATDSNARALIHLGDVEHRLVFDEVVRT